MTTAAALAIPVAALVAAARGATSGTAGFNAASGVVVQRGGKIVGGSGFDLARYHPNGSLDRRFGSHGIARASFGRKGTDLGTGFAVQRDGKIVGTGYTSSRRRTGFDFGLVRFTRAGRLDRAFGKGGRVVTSFGRPSYANAVAIQRDGRIVAAGETYTAAGCCDFALARFNANGTLDQRFGADGKVTTDFGAQDLDEASAVAVDGQGRITVAGQSRQGGEMQFAVARYVADGRLDPGFGSGGLVVTGFPSGPFSSNASARAIVVQRDGRIVAAGSRQTGPNAFESFALARYTSDGKLDPTFGSSGRVITSVGGGDSGAEAIAVQGDGKIVAAGQSLRIDLDRDSRFALARFNVDGSIDAQFGREGSVVTDFGAKNESASALALQRDGRIIAAGVSGRSLALARYRSRGTLDPTFGSGGKVRTRVAAGSPSLRAAGRSPRPRRA